MSTGEQKAGAQISTKAFVQSVLILLALMMVAGILTRTVAAGRYARFVQHEREIIDPQSFQYVERPDHPMGLTVVSYPKRIKWSLKLWLWVLLITIAFLGIGMAINYGPF